MQHASYLLEVHFVDGRPPQTFPFAAGIRIGRDAGDIVLRDPQASAIHCEIEFANGQLIVRDLGSTNGTLFRGQGRSQFAVAQGQEFRAGNTTIRVVQVVGAQAVVAGRTLMAEGAAVPRPPAPQHHVATSPAGASAGSVAGTGQAPKKKGKGGLIAGIAILGILGLAGAAGAYWYFVLEKNPPGADALAANADADASSDGETGEAGETSGETGAEPQPLPEPPPELTDNEPGLPADLDLGELYKSAGAATVVVRVPGSVGSGAVIDPSGVVLTNHHVVDGGKLDGLTAKVKVVLGQYSDEIRAFEPVEGQYDGVVIKYDQERDLALVRIISPPAELASVSLASELPHPGQRVAAIGHAGAGMLWAIKSGEVSATGSLAGHTDLLLHADDGFDKHELERMKAQIEAGGRVIQSTAKILPGDSGGPLLDMQGSIVGVNAFGRIDSSTGQWLSFHVHLEEVRDFTSVIPERPVAFIPSPWSAGGFTPELDDVDLDGTIDTLVLGSGSWGPGPGPQGTLLGAAGWACFLDLDQDSFSGESPKAEAVFKDRNFDAEVIVLYTHGKRHFWYDRDGDGSMDAYLVDNNASGKVNSVYRLDDNGAADPDPSIRIKDGLEDGLDSSLIEDPDQRARFDAIAGSVFPDLVQPEAGSGGMPPVFGKSTEDPVLSDSNGDGSNDTVAIGTSYAQRILWDLDEDSVAGKSASQVGKKIAAKDLDIELATIVQGSTMWMVYDRDNDGEFDLALQTVDLESGVAQYALELDGERRLAVRGFTGRELLRPALVADESLAQRIHKSVAAGLPGGHLDDGLSSFPSLAAGALAHVRLINFPGWERSVAFTTDRGFDITLVDVDRTSKRYEDNEAAIDAVKDGSFDAEFALLRHGSMEWAFYDTNDDGAFDLVRFAANGLDEPAATITYTVDKASATLQPSQDGEPLLRESTFEEHGSKFAEIAKKLFPGRVD